MSWSPLQTLLAVIGALIVAAIVGWIKKPRLVVLVPRLFSHSALTTKGQLAEVSIFNRGMKTEEAIEVSLSPGLRYELVGSNSQDVNLHSGKLVVSRIGAGDDVTSLLLVEGGPFAASDITNCLSKETKGRTVTALEQVPPTGSQRIGLVVVFIAFPALMYAMFSGLDAYFDRERESINKTSEDVVKPKHSSEEVQGWTISSSYIDPKARLYKIFKEGMLKVSVGTPARKGDMVSIPVTLENTSPLVLTASLTMNSQRSAGRLKSFDLRASEILVTPGGNASRSIAVVIPPNGTTVDRMVYLKLFIEEAGGDTLQLTRGIEVAQ